MSAHVAGSIMLVVFLVSSRQNELVRLAVLPFSLETLPCSHVKKDEPGEALFQLGSWCDTWSQEALAPNECFERACRKGKKSREGWVVPTVPKLRHNWGPVGSYDGRGS